MKKVVLYFIILLLPLLIVVSVNEFSRLKIGMHNYTRLNTPAINPTQGNSQNCTWMCHDDTNYCKAHHVTLASNHFATIDPFYFGIINGLKSTGSYGLANILVLVVLIPGLIYLLLIKSIQIQFKIRRIKSRDDGKNS
jgi:hypothetical protein